MGPNPPPLPLRRKMGRIFVSLGAFVLLSMLGCGSSWREGSESLTGTENDPVYDKSIKGADKVTAHAEGGFEPMDVKSFRAYAKSKDFQRLGLGSMEHLFKRLDADNSGGLDRSELAECKRLTAETKEALEAAKDTTKMMSFGQFVEVS